MLLYLSSNSRPDIAYAVNQCARFSSCPKLCHEQAIKRIAKYLIKTRDKGLIIQPDSELKLDLYADADFAGQWNLQNADDPASVKSRSGSIITLGNIPVLWSSKLQTQIATSTMHAEYIALSNALRDLIPIQDLLNEINGKFPLERIEETRIARVWEDNEGAIKLAKKPFPHVTPNSKHYGIKYHWFREKLDELQIEINHIATHLQKADIFTKGLPKNEFEPKRRMLLGW